LAIQIQLQPTIYGKTNPNFNEIKLSTYTKFIMEKVKELFPKLIQSENYETYQGIIVSKKNYTGNNISLEQMGKILGYPCYEEFKNIDRDYDHYTISITALVKMKNVGIVKIDLFSNICKDISKKKEFENIALQAKKCFKEKKTKVFLNEIFIDNNIDIVNVIVEVEHISGMKSVLDKLIKSINLKKDDKNLILNIIYNIGFTFEGIDNFELNFQYKNPIHIGILINILLNTMNDTLEPFYPLQKYPNQDAQIRIITKKLEDSLIDTLKKTQIKKMKIMKITKKTKK
jgi:hypothetical protein